SRVTWWCLPLGSVGCHRDSLGSMPFQSTPAGLSSSRLEPVSSPDSACTDAPVPYKPAGLAEGCQRLPDRCGKPKSAACSPTCRPGSAQREDAEAYRPCPGAAGDLCGATSRGRAGSLVDCCGTPNHCTASDPTPRLLCPSGGWTWTYPVGALSGGEP